MANDDQETEDSDKKEHAATESNNLAQTAEQAAAIRRARDQRMSNSGFTKAFHKPLSNPEEDSLALKAEKIKSEYEQLAIPKRVAIGGVSGTFGDLLSGKSAEKASEIEKRIFESSSDKRVEEPKEAGKIAEGGQEQQGD